jgi:hypothetical protein
MLDSTFGLLLVPPLGAAGMVGVSHTVRELVCRHRWTARAAIWGGVLSVVAGALMAGAGAQLVRGVAVALLAGAVWIPFARARGWGSRSTLPRRFDWALFEVQFQAYLEYSTRRRERRERDGGP